MHSKTFFVHTQVMCFHSFGLYYIMVLLMKFLLTVVVSYTAASQSSAVTGCSRTTTPVTGAWQSSTVVSQQWLKSISRLGGYTPFIADNAVDGRLATSPVFGQCAQTTPETSPWWQSELDTSYYVTSVKILSSSSQTVLPRNISVEVGEIKILFGQNGWGEEWQQSRQLCVTHPGELSKGAYTTLTCSYPLLGNYVRITMAGTEEDVTLSLCEVVIEGTGVYCVATTSTVTTPTPTPTTSLVLSESLYVSTRTPTQLSGVLLDSSSAMFTPERSSRHLLTSYLTLSTLSSSSSHSYASQLISEIQSTMLSPDSILTSKSVFYTHSIFQTLQSTTVSPIVTLSSLIYTTNAQFTTSSAFVPESYFTSSDITPSLTIYTLSHSSKIKSTTVLSEVTPSTQTLSPEFTLSMSSSSLLHISYDSYSEWSTMPSMSSTSSSELITSLTSSYPVFSTIPSMTSSILLYTYRHSSTPISTRSTVFIHSSVISEVTSSVVSASESGQISPSSSSRHMSVRVSPTPSMCPCACSKSALIADLTQNNKTKEQVAQEIAEKIVEMTVDTKTTTASQRKLTSATDGRQSVKLVGTVGAVFTAVVFGSVVISDIPVFFGAVKRLVNYIRHTYCKGKEDPKPETHVYNTRTVFSMTEV